MTDFLSVLRTEAYALTVMVLVKVIRFRSPKGKN